MKLLEEMPESGQFISIHKYKGRVWSSTYKYINGVLNIFSDSDDEFIEETCELNSHINYKYIIDID